MDAVRLALRDSAPRVVAAAGAAHHTHARARSTSVQLRASSGRIASSGQHLAAASCSSAKPSLHTRSSRRALNRPRWSDSIIARNTAGEPTTAETEEGEAVRADAEAEVVDEPAIDASAEGSSAGEGDGGEEDASESGASENGSGGGDEEAEAPKPRHAEVSEALMAFADEFAGAAPEDAEDFWSRYGALASDAETELVSLYSRLAEAESHAASAIDDANKVKDQYLRLNADFDNFRKRTEAEKDSLKQTAMGNTLEELLPVIDNFELARSQLVLETESEQKISDSYQNLYKQMVEILKKLGLVAIEAVGEAFDPELHDAIMQEETTEHASDVVLAEFRKGFTFKDRLLRPSMVKVSVNSAAPAPEQGAEGDEGEGEDAEAPAGEGNQEEEASDA